MIAPQNYGQPALQEYLLLDYVQRLETRRQGHRAVHIHLSRLKSFHRRDYHIRVATNTFESYVKLFVGRIFALSNDDLVFVWKDRYRDEVEPAVERLKYLFRDDPLTNDRSEETGFCTWYNINTQYQDFLYLCRYLDTQSKQRQEEITSGSSASAKKMEPITAENLAQLEDTIRSADLSDHIRQQPICIFTNGEQTKIRPIFDEFFISIPDLRNSVIPNTDLTANRWLFQHMTEVLDKRMLHFLSRKTFRTHSKSFSINLNLETLLTREFKHFDEIVRQTWPGNVILELNQIDLFANLETYLDFRDDLHDRGYRILIDNLTLESLSFVSRKNLQADFIKVAWREEMADTVLRQKYKEIDNLVETAGRERVILCHCDVDSAVTFGQSLGMTLFQGRYIDQLVAQKQNKKRAQKPAPKT